MESNELKIISINLFEQLGLYAQAKNIAQDTRLENIDTVGFARLLRKHNLGFTVHKSDTNKIKQAMHPFVVIPDDKPAQLIRRRGDKFECLVENKQWQDFKFSDIALTSHVFFIDKIPGTRESAKTFAAHMSKRTKWYKPVFWLSLLASLSALAVPLFTMSVYDRVIGGQAPDALPKIALGAAIAIIILVVSRLIRAKVLSTTSNRFARDLSEIMFQRLLSMPLMVLSRVGITNHIARMRNAEKVRMLLSGPGGAGLVDLPFAIIAFATIAILSGWLVLVPIIMLGLYYLVMKGLNKYAQKATPVISGDYQNAINELSKNILQLKACGNTDSWKTKFARLVRENARQNFLYSKRNGLNAAAAHALSMFTALATVFTGIFLVLNQSITPGALIACVMLIWRITGPAQLAFSSSSKFTMLQGSIAQFDRFMQARTEQNGLRLDIVDTSKPPAISFQHVTLRYSAEGEPALAGVTVDIEPGEHVAVIGPNGCGKTSMLLAALGVIEPQAGFVTVNQKNLKQYDPEAFRSHAAFSPVEPDIFPGTLAQNLRIAKSDASDEQLIEAMNASGGNALFAALGNDINANILGQGNNMLSAVEGGYISLARAFLKKSKLLILDEPIANRNPAAKQQLIATLAKLKGNTTVIFSSHDQELIKLADKVVVLDKGAVVFAGPLPDENNEPQPAQEQQ
ncbi:ATP-binding cassette domain-containing protein [Colwelliaceae bacterium BS250]